MKSTQINADQRNQYNHNPSCHLLVTFMQEKQLLNENLNSNHAPEPFRNYYFRDVKASSQQVRNYKEILI